jgi:hypothetical protein
MGIVERTTREKVEVVVGTVGVGVEEKRKI